MKKILIISYFFPPCNLTASQRIQGWANYLSSFGYYPTIVTRNWEKSIHSPEDALISSGSEIIHQKNKNFEVFYLPYQANKRDFIFTKYKDNKYLQKISKFGTFKELILENFSNKYIPSSNLYEFSKNLILENPEFKAVIVSAKPFIQFKFGYQLNKEFGVKWIADYRDDWNTSELESKKGFLKSLISKLQSRSEKKWLSSASFITSISKIYVDRISEFVGKDGEVILNGFDYLNTKLRSKLNKNNFNIVYNGSLYETQPIEPFLDAIKKIIDNYDINIQVHVYFPGLGFDKNQEKRVRNKMIGYENNISITDRIPKEEVIAIQEDSDLLLMISHLGFKGVSSSKMYEYIGLKKRIFLFPNDNDIVEETLNETELGVICNDENDIYLKLVDLILKKRDNELSQIFVNQEKINFYSREIQTKALANLLDKL